MTHQQALKFSKGARAAQAQFTPILVKAGGRCLWQIQGPNNSVLEGWAIGRRVVIVQAFEEAGWSHYLQSENDNNLADATIELLTLAE